MMQNPHKKPGHFTKKAGILTIPFIQFPQLNIWLNHFGFINKLETILFSRYQIFVWLLCGIDILIIDWYRW